MRKMVQETVIGEENNSDSGGFGLGAIIVMVSFLGVAVLIGLALLRQDMGRFVDEKASNFSFRSFEGESYQLEDFRGQVVVLNFWASWCVGCRDEAPEFQSAWEKYEDQDVVFLGIAYADDDSNALQFLDYYGISYLNAPDRGAVIYDLYNVTALPQTFIIDQNGDVVRWFVSPINESQLSSVIDDLLLIGF